MVMNIRWVIITADAPIGFECFLHDLMAHKTYIEPVSVIEQQLCDTQVLIHELEPFVRSVFVCLIYLYIYDITLQR